MEPVKPRSPRICFTHSDYAGIGDGDSRCCDPIAGADFGREICPTRGQVRGCLDAESNISRAKVSREMQSICAGVRYVWIRAKSVFHEIAGAVAIGVGGVVHD